VPCQKPHKTHSNVVYFSQQSCTVGEPSSGDNTESVSSLHLACLSFLFSFCIVVSFSYSPKVEHLRDGCCITQMEDGHSKSQTTISYESVEYRSGRARSVPTSSLRAAWRSQARRVKHTKEKAVGEKMTGLRKTLRKEDNQNTYKYYYKAIVPNISEFVIISRTIDTLNTREFSSWILGHDSSSSFTSFQL